MYDIYENMFVLLTVFLQESHRELVLMEVLSFENEDHTPPGKTITFIYGAL